MAFVTKMKQTACGKSEARPSGVVSLASLHASALGRPLGGDLLFAAVRIVLLHLCSTKKRGAALFEVFQRRGVKGDNLTRVIVFENKQNRAVQESVGDRFSRTKNQQLTRNTRLSGCPLSKIKPRVSSQSVDTNRRSWKCPIATRCT